MTTGSQIDSLTTDKSMELSEVQTAPPSQGRIELPHKPDSENLTGINHAGLKLDYDSYRHFLDQGRNLIEPNNEFLEDAVKYLNKNHWRNFKEFLKPWGWQQVTIIHLAAHHGKKDILERAVTFYPPTPSADEPEEITIDPLLATDKLGRCALHYAASEGRSNVVSWILERMGPDPSSHPQLTLEDVFGRTPLHDAAGNLHADVVRLLVDAGAPVNVPNRKGVPPYLPAASDEVVQKAESSEVLPEDLSRYEEIVRIFIEKKVDVNLQYPKDGLTYGWTMLYFALFMGSHDATQRLLENGAFQRLPSIANQTNVPTKELVLVFAVKYYRNLDCIRALVKNGANLATTTHALGKGTVLEELLTYLEDEEAVNFFIELLDERIRSTRDEKESVILGFQTLLPGSEQQMALVSLMMKTMNRTELQSVLQHPLLHAFVGEKWLHVSIVFYIFLTLYTIFVISLSGYTIDLVLNKRDHAGLRYFTFSLASIFFCHNFQQVMDEPIKRVFSLGWHIRHFENWLMFVSLTISMVVAIAGAFISSASTPWVLHTLSIAIPLSWIQIVLFLGRIPAVDLLDIRYYALLFSIVLKHVFRVLFIGSLIIVGFSFSFLILLRSNEQFKDPLVAFLKTIVMTTGEFDYSELFSGNSTNNSTEHNVDSEDLYGGPSTDESTITNLIIGRILFLIFVIVMNIVFMNLTIGLVINDIQSLEKEGQCNRLLQRGKFITDFERVAKCLRGRSSIPQCLKIWLKKRSVIKNEAIVCEDTHPTLWRDICTVVQRKDRREKSRIMKSRSNTKAASLATIQSVVDAIESSQQTLMSQIQQLVRERNGGPWSPVDSNWPPKKPTTLNLRSP